MEIVNGITSGNEIATEIGFDAGDESRGVTLSQEIHSLQSVNTFRIDGKVLANCRAQNNCEVNNCQLSNIQRGAHGALITKLIATSTESEQLTVIQGVNLGRSQQRSPVNSLKPAIGQA